MEIKKRNGAKWSERYCISMFSIHNPCAIDCEFLLTALSSAVYIIIRKVSLVYLVIFKSVQARAAAVKSIAELVCSGSAFGSRHPWNWLWNWLQNRLYSFGFWLRFGFGFFLRIWLSCKTFSTSFFRWGCKVWVVSSHPSFSPSPPSGFQLLLKTLT